MYIYARHTQLATAGYSGPFRVSWSAGAGLPYRRPFGSADDETGPFPGVDAVAGFEGERVRTLFRSEIPAG